MKIIARIHSDFPEKFGIPRQSGLVDALEATIVFEPEYRNPAALMGITGYSHLWLLWQFSEAVRDTWSPTVHPPRLGVRSIWVSLPPVPRSVPIPSVCRRCVCWPWRMILSWGLSCGSPERI